MVTMGERGALVHGPDGRHVIAATDATDATVASALGAGDAFAGGFLHGMLSGRASRESLWLGYSRVSAVLRVQQARAPL